MSSPFELMRRMSEDMERMFGSMSSWPMSSPTQNSLWSPAVEVEEKEGSLVVRAELPGMSKDDVKVELAPEGLLIEGERKQTHEERGERGMVRSEWRYGRFSRLIPLPDEANVGQAKAQFRDGILEVTVPIPEEKRRRREIPIESGGGQSPQAA
jgi:HSP20 family protein